jgi:sporulation protein YlmC with PRC-barrel domain
MAGVGEATPARAEDRLRVDKEKALEIPINEVVRCFDGQVGRSTHIIVDLVTEQGTHFVVRTEKHGGEYLVPLDLVASSGRAGILLDCHKKDVYQLHPFKASYFHGFDAYDGAPPVPSPGMAASYTLYHPYRTAESSAESSSALPSSAQLAMSKGAAVLATDGEVGKIDELVIDPETRRVSHLVLHKHHLLQERAITIPVTDIERVEMDTVYLKIDKDAVAASPTVILKKFPWERAGSKGH